MRLQLRARTPRPTLLVTLLAASGAAGLSSSVAVSRRLSLKSTASPWLDITDDVSAALPALDSALVQINTADAAQRLAVLDPAVLSFGAPGVVADGRPSVALGARGGELMLPPRARVIAYPDGEACDADAADAWACELQLRVEAAEPLPPSGAEAISQAALRSALSTQGVDRAAVEALERAPEPTPAMRVYDSFVAKSHRSEQLLPAAGRAAHHIRHLLRADAARADEVLRNVDDASRAEVVAELPPHRVHLLLDNVRSAYNVGSIFRTADTARIAEVVTCGFTPHPPNPKLAKTAFGAIASMPTRHEESTLQAVAELQDAGVKVYAMETTDASINFASVEFPPTGVALILGNEETGVDGAVREAADGVIEIPTFGMKNSLNVASAAAVVIFEVLRQWGHLETPPRKE